MQNDFELDAKFEQALTSYADPAKAGDPQALTRRVLVALEERRQHYWWVRLTIAAPALACLLLVAFLTQRQHQSANQTTTRAVQVPATPPILPSASTAEVSHVEQVHVTAARHAQKHLPKLDQFPTPTPLTEQEQLLIQFSGQAPTSTKQQIAKTQKESDAPLRIADLTIPKLDSNTQPQ
ncbi:hypothetical protein [Alloacidobacterium sp.]|uniref:hypothetical protein n=1 Tax=Alloacidobacterium sp. TaxID=2951999 RepID=UPI002D297B83|nr:hypothetical protein [Alloacidobacterium sp.]HYK34961.1 hypothetical protein [Alloacidobacterium sp.]